MKLTVEFNIKDAIYNNIFHNFYSWVDGERKSAIISEFTHQGRTIVFNDLDFQEALAKNFLLRNCTMTEFVKSVDYEFIA